MRASTTGRGRTPQTGRGVVERTEFPQSGLKSILRRHLIFGAVRIVPRRSASYLDDLSPVPPASLAGGGPSMVGPRRPQGDRVIVLGARPFASLPHKPSAVEGRRRSTSLKQDRIHSSAPITALTPMSPLSAPRVPTHPPPSLPDPGRPRTPW